MFYSKELLSRRTPLGIAWFAAHNKLGKLPRGSIMNVDIASTCKQILFPSVPHSLRTSAVLANGVVIIHNKQSGFLLQDCENVLQKVQAMSKAKTIEQDAPVAREDAITLRDDVDILDAATLFPTFQPTMSLATTTDADLFIMPSVPENTSEYRPLLGAPRASHANATDQADVFTMPDGMDIMEAPELPPGDFNLMMGAMDGLPGLDPGMYLPEEAQLQRQGTATPEPLGEDATRARAKRRRKKAQVDDIDKILIHTEDIKLQLTAEGRKPLMVPRPLPPQPAETSLLLLDPATSPWAPRLQAVWEAAGKVGGRTWAEQNERIRNENSDLEAGPKRVRRGHGAGKDAAGLLAEDHMLPPMPMDDGYSYDVMVDHGTDMGGPLDEENPFRDAALRREAALSLGGSEGMDLETERLRAALNGTPGGDFRDAMFQRLTPASGSDRLSNGRRTRSSTGLRRDSEGGRLSEKSSDRGRDKLRLSDLLGDLQEGEGDLAVGLPAVGMDEAYLNGGHGGAEHGSEGLSQFRLIEESGPSMPSGPALSPGDDLQTLQVLSLMKPMMEKHHGSLFGVTSALSRLEAAKMFAHMLVACNRGYILMEQQEAYGDIEITLTI